jgi:putative tryptophan/tyrosine transport system substrate-binding protein
MRRREFITLIGGSAAWPHSLLAQGARGAKPCRIVTLPDIHPSVRDVFIDALRQLDWIEGRDFVVIMSGFQWGAMDGIDDVVRGLVAENPDLFLAGSDPYALAVNRASTSIPIVLVGGGYPIHSGLAESLAKPGKNVTGLSAYASTELWSKLLQLLREAKPDIKRIGILWTYLPLLFPATGVEPAIAELRYAEGALDLKLHFANAKNSDEVPAALAEIKAERPDALLLTSGGLAISARQTVTEFAVRHHLPTIVDGWWGVNVNPHPLLMYGTPYPDLLRSAAYYVDKILKGALPGELPIQQPAKVVLRVNLKTATAIGITVPPTLLGRADEVVE